MKKGGARLPLSIIVGRGGDLKTGLLRVSGYRRQAPLLANFDPELKRRRGSLTVGGGGPGSPLVVVIIVIVRRRVTKFVVSIAIIANSPSYIP